MNIERTYFLNGPNHYLVDNLHSFNCIFKLTLGLFLMILLALIPISVN